LTVKRIYFDCNLFCPLIAAAGPLFKSRHPERLVQNKKRGAAGLVRKRHFPNIDVRTVSVPASEGVGEFWNGFKTDGATGRADKIEKLLKMKADMATYVEHDMSRSEETSVAPAEKELVVRKTDSIMELSKGFSHGNRRADWSILCERIFRVFSDEQYLHQRT
jgi:hypothetical protein